MFFQNGVRTDPDVIQTAPIHFMPVIGRISAKPCAEALENHAWTQLVP